jgi:hypothetical protein
LEMDNPMINEVMLQPLVHSVLSDPSIVWETVSGKRLQILSPGRRNVDAGPDFLDMAILLDGMIIVGNAEYHRSDEDWFRHGHQDDPAYQNIILHIISRLINKDRLHHETLLIEEEKLLSSVGNGTNEVGISDFNSTIEDLQQFALMRLLRRTSDTQKQLNSQGLDNTFLAILKEYLQRYFSRKKRPQNTLEKLKTGIENFRTAQIYYFLVQLKGTDGISVPDYMITLLKSSQFGEGPHLRREILVNCILPLAICLANEKDRIALFMWYWSTPALNKYGMLDRRFPGLPQNFLWQQQGMLEYIKDHGKKSNIISETIRDYGFAEVLSFYKLARAPINTYIEDIEEAD